MIHNKFRENLSTGSGEEDFGRVYTIYGHGGNLGHVTSIMFTNFHLHLRKSLHTNFVKKKTTMPSGF